MPPSESQILTTYLLPPSPLPTILPPPAFPPLFPPSAQSSPQINALYRDLQHQRALVVDAVARAVAGEVKKGNMLRRVVRRTRSGGRGDGGGGVGQDDEIVLEEMLFPPTQNLQSHAPHTLHTILPVLQSATTTLSDEIRRLEDEAAQLMSEIEGTVGGMSDLRYGKLANPSLSEEVREGLGRLEGVCRGS